MKRTSLLLALAASFCVCIGGCQTTHGAMGEKSCGCHHEQSEKSESCGCHSGSSCSDHENEGKGSAK